jgi:ring-1,2-phenylacetyl-CoA epoxidase subunit PaaC
MFIPADYEKETGIDFSKIKEEWSGKVGEVFTEATLIIPEKIYMQTGGKTGKHTEYLGYILTELQYLQRTYPGCEW